MILCIYLGCSVQVQLMERRRRAGEGWLVGICGRGSDGRRVQERRSRMRRAAEGNGVGQGGSGSGGHDWVVSCSLERRRVHDRGVVAASVAAEAKGRDARAGRRWW
jgi:hypothetical protein